MASKLRRQLTTVAPNAETLLVMTQREIIPVLREVRTVLDSTTSGAAVITGSRSGDPIGVLTRTLSALAALGIITDNTTP